MPMPNKEEKIETVVLVIAVLGFVTGFAIALITWSMP